MSYSVLDLEKIEKNKISVANMEKSDQSQFE
jgi:hypothetical protein